MSDPLDYPVEEAIQADPALRLLRQEVVSRCDHADAAHDLSHPLRVAVWALRIGGGSLDPREVIAAALLHDVVNPPLAELRESVPDRLWMVETIEDASVAPADLVQIRRLMGDAFGAKFTEHDWEHTQGGTRFVVRNDTGDVVVHAAVVPRALEIAGQRYSTGYVEAVATQPALQRQGLASSVMEAVGHFIKEHYEVGALSTSTNFYEKLGWVRWRGATWYRLGEEVVRTPDEDGGVMVLELDSSGSVDLGSDIIAEWRPGDVW